MLVNKDLTQKQYDKFSENQTTHFIWNFTLTKQLCEYQFFKSKTNHCEVVSWIMYWTCFTQWTSQWENYSKMVKLSEACIIRPIILNRVFSHEFALWNVFILELMIS